MDADLHQKVMLALLGKTATKGADAAIRIVVEACAGTAEGVCERTKPTPTLKLVVEAFGNEIAAAIRGIVK